MRDPVASPGKEGAMIKEYFTIRNMWWHLAGVAVMMMAIAAVAHGAQPPANLWQGLEGEAVSDGARGMFAVACVVRNRLAAGMDTGLVALKRRNLGLWCAKNGVKYELLAKSIVKQVFQDGVPDVTGGATHYEAVERYGWPRWARGMVVTAHIGEHWYMKKGSHGKH